MSILNQENWHTSETTNNIQVTVTPEYYAGGSNLEQNIFVWLYTINIQNFSTAAIQIVGRHWQIFDTHGRIEEVRGEGLAGQQPVIQPNEAFSYTSQVRLFTASGLMRGEYIVIDLTTNTQFNIIVPAFSLDSVTDKTIGN